MSTEVDKLSQEDISAVPGVGSWISPADLPVPHDDDEDDLPLKPNIDTKEREFNEREVFYDPTRRTAADVVLSGPIVGGWGPGRYHKNRALAKRFLVLKYGAARVREIEGNTTGRWAFLVKGLRRSSDGLRHD